MQCEIVRSSRRRIGPRGTQYAPYTTWMALVLAATGVLAMAGAMAVALAMTTPGPAVAVEVAAEAVVGRHVEPFELSDFRGHRWSLADDAGPRATVIVFLGNGCPLAKLYAPRLVELAASYADRGVRVVGINSNHQDSITEMAAYAAHHELTFPLLKDPANAIADRLGAQRTPEVFVLDEAHVVRYRGRIDDQFGPGYQRPTATEHDLTRALDELLAGREVSCPQTEALGCLIGRVKRPVPHGEVTYAGQISRFVARHCLECHREGEAAPFSLTNYDEVVGWAEMMQEVMREGRMPPWFANPAHGHFSNARVVSDEERAEFDTWVANGCPEGDASDLPEPVEFADGWSIPEPDDVFYMSAAPFRVPAEGVVEYQHFVVDPGFTEDRWIQAAEARPGNRAVVHHIIVFVQRPGSGGGGFTSFNNPQLGYAPGMQPRVFPKGMAMYVAAGSKLIFQMHYTPVGSEQEDLSYVGFVYANKEDVELEVEGGVCGNVALRIPPGDPHHVVKASRRFRQDTLLVSMLPHMHLRGKSFRYELEYPDGQREVLLDVPRYDFGWQLWYNPIEPKLLPRGSRMHCTAVFDNSAENLTNPDPTVQVTWGEQTWEEMMFGFFSTARPRGSGAATDDDDAPRAGLLNDEGDGEPRPRRPGRARGATQ